MKTASFFASIMLVATAVSAQAQNPENWTKDQLEEPAQLAQTLKEATNIPTIISVGPGAIIPQSVDIGSVKEKDNLVAFQKLLKGLPKKQAIVVYCGCCPFEHCPNVRPAIAALRAGGFSNYKLLNIPHNIKTDWIDKGYPSSKL